MDITTILKAYGIDSENREINPLGDGLINSTWLVVEKITGRKFVFQRVNEKVFKSPEDITFNIRLINDYL